MKPGKYLTAKDLKQPRQEKRNSKGWFGRTKHVLKVAFCLFLFLMGLALGIGIGGQEPSDSTELASAREEIGELKAQIEEYVAKVAKLESRIAKYKESLETTVSADTLSPSGETEEAQPQRTTTAEAQAVPYEIVGEKDISHKAMGTKRLSDGPEVGILYHFKC